MDDNISRRSFIKSAGVVAGVAATAGFSANSYAQNEKVRLGIIGTGVQGRIAHMGEGLRVHDDKIQIVAICDVWKYSQSEALKVLKDQGKEAVPVYVDYREMIDKEKLDAVLIATPLFTHYQNRFIKTGIKIHFLLNRVSIVTGPNEATNMILTVYF